MKHHIALILASLSSTALAKSTELVATEAEGGLSSDLVSSDTYPDGGAADLAQELTNPLASLVTIPIQTNFDLNVGPLDDGFKMTTNIQPVVPFELNDDWNLITRTIIPVIHQEDLFPGSGTQSGLGDITASVFFAPREPTSGGVIWGVGPAFLFPTASDSLLGSDKWGLGPSAVALKIDGPWTYGALVNHIWSVAGDSDRPEVNGTFFQPFVAYTTPDAWTLSIQTETSYNWTAESWSIPVNVSVSKLVKIGKLPVSLQAGTGYWAESPAAGPEGFRFRLQANFVLPKW
jgi:hypothetical protein